MVPLQQQYLTFCFLFPTISFKFVCFFTVKQLRSDVKCAAHTFVLAHQQSWAGKAIIYSTATELHSFGRRNYRVGGARWVINKEVFITPILFFRMVSVPHKILPATLLAAFIIFLFACDFFFYLFVCLGCFFLVCVYFVLFCNTRETSFLRGCMCCTANTVAEANPGGHQAGFFGSTVTFHSGPYGGLVLPSSC